MRERSTRERWLPIPGLVLAAMLVAGACGSSDTEAESELDAGAEAASAEESSDEEGATTTTGQVTTTTEATTTTTKATTTTTEGDDALNRGVIDLRELGIEDGLTAIDSGYQKVFGPADLGSPGGFSGAVDDGLLPAPCGTPHEFEFFQRTGYGYTYPVEELGWPDDGVVYDIVLTVHQVLFDDSTIAADLRTKTDSCIGDIDWPLSPSGSGGWLARTDTPQVDGIDDAQMYIVVNATDGIIWLQYGYSADDLGGILLMAGASPLDVDEFVTSQVNPIVELAQQQLVDCLATPKCRDFNNN